MYRKESTVVNKEATKNTGVALHGQTNGKMFHAEDTYEIEKWKRRECKWKVVDYWEACD